jgi:hypothetical protein
MSFYRLTFATGLAIGFVAGTRAGRERYDQMVRAAKAATESPAFQQAAGVVQARASGLLSSAGAKVADRAPKFAQSAMHTVGDHVPLLKNRDGDGSADGEGGHDGAVPASGNGHSRKAGS